MNRFEMTCDRVHLWTPFVLGPLLVGGLAASVFLSPKVGHPAMLAGPALVVGVLLVATLLKPRALRLTPSELVLERLCWPAFRVPLSALEAVEVGPETRACGGVIRVAGVGGWFWSGGLFRAKGVGLVRAWLTRLGPTVIVRRAHGLPLLFGVDDPRGLEQALVARLGRG